MKDNNNFSINHYAKYVRLLKILNICVATTFIHIFPVLAVEKGIPLESISLNVENVSLKQALNELEKSTDYLFLIMDEAGSELNKKISANLIDKTIDEILDFLLKDSVLSYTVNMRQITIQKNPRIDAKENRQNLPDSQKNIRQNRETKIIKGVVIDEEGKPLVAASVSVKGTTIATFTDVDGTFSLTISTDIKELTFSYIGYKEQTLQTKPYMEVVMVPDSRMLTDVVVTGMQQVDKRLFTGVADKLEAEDILMSGIADISRSLEGRSAGVTIQNVSGTFGTAPKIRVRGATSIYGNSKPLWVVDGVIIEDVAEVSTDRLSSGDAITLISSAIAGLNADDIESFDILKDGSATSIYGARAMAGVIVVTTKKGKVGTNRINYTGEFTYRLKPSYKNFNIMNSQEQMGIYKELEANGYLNMARVYRASESGVYGKMYSLINTFDRTNGTFGLPNTLVARNKYLQQAEYRNTDWFDVLFNNNISMNHAISLSGGNEKARYYTSLSFMDDPGWTMQSSVKRYTLNLNALYKIYDNLSLNLIGNASYRKQVAPGTLAQDIDVVSGKVKRDFDINPYSYALNSSRTLDQNTMYVRNYAPFNILNELNNNYIDLDLIDSRFQGELKWKTTKKVEASVLFAYKYSSTTQGHSIKDYSNQAWAYRAMDDATIRDKNPWLYTDPDHPNSLPVSVLPVGGFYNETKYTMNGYDFRGTIAYNDVFDEKHIFNLFAGSELNSIDRQVTRFDGVAIQYEMGLLPAFNYQYFKQLSEQNGNYYRKSLARSRQLSFFGTLTYSYLGKYILNGTVRHEGSNRLGKSRSARWLPTWNISGAWNVYEESFFENFSPGISHLSLKASYSLTADGGPASVSNSYVEISSYNPWRPFTRVKESGLDILNLENQNLTYEKKHEFNLGFGTGFLDNRINFSFDWYKRNNFDLIGIVNTIGAGGQISKFANVAEMKSHGVELSLFTKNIINKDFQWASSFIFSNARNKVTKLESNTTRVIDMITGTGFTMEGYPVRSLFSLNFQGLNEEGLPTFINEDKNVTVNDIDFQSTTKKAHLVYEGPTEAPITGSLGNIFTYKNLNLNIFITYSFGNFIRLNPVFKDNYSDLDAMPREFKNRWTLPNDETKTNIPVIADDFLKKKYNNQLDYAFNAYSLSTARVAKGDFIRMKEISLAYGFPQKITSSLRIKDLSVKVQASNLFLIYADKKLNGQDPEFFNTGGVAAPLPRQFTMTVKIGF